MIRIGKAALMFNACGFNMYQNVNTSACKYCLCTDKFLWACAYVCECLCSRWVQACLQLSVWSYKVGLHINYTCQKQYFVREKRGLRTCTDPTTEKRRCLSHMPLRTQTSSQVVSFKLQAGTRSNTWANSNNSCRLSYHSFLFAQMLQCPGGVLESEWHIGCV